MDRDFYSEDFDAEHFVCMILDALSMTYFTEAQREEVRRRRSVEQKRRWSKMSEESREEARLAMSNAAKRGWNNRSEKTRQEILLALRNANK